MRSHKFSCKPQNFSGKIRGFWLATLIVQFERFSHPYGKSIHFPKGFHTSVVWITIGYHRAGMYLYGNSIPFHNNILMYRHGFHSVKLGIVHSSPLWYPQRKTMANCRRYRQVSGIGNLWECSGVKLWTIHSLAVWKPFWKTMESDSWVSSSKITSDLGQPTPTLFRLRRRSTLMVSLSKITSDLGRPTPDPA